MRAQVRQDVSNLPFHRHDDTREDIRAGVQELLSDASWAIILLLNFAVAFSDCDT